MKKQIKQTVKARLEAAFKNERITGNARQSIQELVRNGTTRTGSSGYSKGWANKSTWTALTVHHAQRLGLVVEQGNDAPRGGANGEFVKLVDDRRKNKLVHQFQVIYKRALVINKIKIERQNEALKAEAIEHGNAVEAEFQKIKPLIMLNATDIVYSRTLTGEQKSAKQQSILKGMLETANIEKSVDFWYLWRKVIKYFKETYKS